MNGREVSGVRFQVSESEAEGAKVSEGKAQMSEGIACRSEDPSSLFELRRGKQSAED